MTQKEQDKFDIWFSKTFPQYVCGKEFIEPYYSVSIAAYEKGLKDGGKKC